jgi:hypothetical protein
MKKTIGLIGLAVAAYLLYKYNEKNTQVPIAPTPTPSPTPPSPRPISDDEVRKSDLKQQGASLIEPYYESEAGKLAEKRFKQRLSANDILLFTGEKQYVTLENLIPNRYGQYNNFSGNYNRLNAEDTTNILSAERTQSLYKRPKPTFNNTL